MRRGLRPWVFQRQLRRGARHTEKKKAKRYGDSEVALEGIFFDFNAIVSIFRDTGVLSNFLKGFSLIFELEAF